MECYAKRDVEIPASSCNEEADCHRTYHLYFPSVLCGHVPPSHRDLADSSPASTEKSDVGTLPLVFAIHCFGCTAESMTSLVAHADSTHVVLVIPEGLNSSFNAVNCCGYALENNVDDIGFFRYIQSTLSDEYAFLDQDYSYGLGWSNGGFMVTHAASLFRAISPISGYLPEIDPAVTKGGSFCVDGICVDAPSTGKGIFLHHGLKDKFVSSAGCCNDPDKPKCCCNIAADTCVSVMDVAKNWAVEVNGCGLAEEGDGDNTGSDREEGGEGNEEKQRENEENSVGDESKEDIGSAGEINNNEQDGNEEQEAVLVPSDSSGALSGPGFAISFVDEERGIECLTATGEDCKANATLCIHARSGHFNDPSFGESFPFAKEIFDFFARDACEVQEGTWTNSRTCSCPEDRGGLFCFDSRVDANSVVSTQDVSDNDEDMYDVGLVAAPPQESRKVSVAISLLLFALGTSYVIRRRHKRGQKKDDRYSNDVTDEESTELVSSDVYHMK